MKQKRYFTIGLKIDPLTIIHKLNLKYYSLLDNGENSFMLGYCLNKDDVMKINVSEDYNNLQSKTGYRFGYIPYDHKNLFLPKAASSNSSFHKLEAGQFFSAEGVLISKNKTQLFYGTKNEYTRVSQILKNTHSSLPTNNGNIVAPIVKLKHRTSQLEYIKNVEAIKSQIQIGNIYEMNYCVTAQSKNLSISPVTQYKKLKSLTKAPFSSLIQINEATVLSASPERFIKKHHLTLTSQPIKGTIKRGQTTEEDEQLKLTLKADQKEISENVMIVDLVRNDLSKIALKGSVKTTELCKIYSFKTVHQLISTVECQISKTASFQSILGALFPMGSMTGAPKLSATNIIDRYENFKREIYSGAIGYIAPNSSFDFNVVIRSIIHNNRNNTTSISVGSAITIKSTPENEYNECLLKLSAIEKALY